MEESGLAAIGPVIAGDAGAFELLAVARADRNDGKSELAERRGGDEADGRTARGRTEEGA